MEKHTGFFFFFCFTHKEQRTQNFEIAFHEMCLLYFIQAVNIVV